MENEGLPHLCPLDSLNSNQGLPKLQRRISKPISADGE